MDRTLPLLMAQSAATDAFKADVRAYAGHESAPRISTSRHAPRVKVLRLLAQLFEREPGLPVDRVQVDGVSGCADFRGLLTVETAAGVQAFDFAWDCHWRAREEGWVDCFGLPDQIRAAREFGHRCFERWEAVAVDPAEHTRRAS
jgi:hypothetical protein